MSYILKALRLSEEERAKGHVPSLATRHRRSSHHPRRKVWPWVLGGFVALSMLLVMFAVWPTQISSSTNVQSAQPVLELNRPPETLLGAPEPAAEPALRDPRLQDIDGLPAPQASSGEQPLDIAASLGSESIQEARLTDEVNRNWLDEDLAPEPAPAVQASPETAPPAPEEPIDQAARTNGQAKPQRNSAAFDALSAADFTEQALMDWAEDEVLSGDLPQAEEEVQIALADPVDPLPEEAVEPAPVTDAYSDVPPLWQLPHEIRSLVPEVLLSVHVYAPEDSSRFVIINRKRYRQGDTVEGRIQLEAIIPTGVVLDFDGHRFKVGNQ